MEFEKTAVPSVRKAFVQAIEDKILSGELKVGDRLPAFCVLITDYF